MSFPREHRAKLHSNNPIERVNGEVKRRTEVVGIFPNEDAIVRLVGAILLEQNDEWAVQRARYMTLVWMPAVMQGLWNNEHVIECGLVSGLSVAAVFTQRAGMVIRGSGPNLESELK